MQPRYLTEKLVTCLECWHLLGTQELITSAVDAIFVYPSSHYLMSFIILFFYFQAPLLPLYILLSPFCSSSLDISSVSFLPIDVFHNLSASFLKSLIPMSILTRVPCLSCFPSSCLHFFLLLSLSRTADNTSGHSALGSFSLPFCFSYSVDRIDALCETPTQSLTGFHKGLV